MSKRIERIHSYRYPVSQPTVFDEQELTVLELVSKIAYKINETVGEVNSWIDYLDIFVEGFDKNLQGKVIKTLTEWQDSGLLDVIIDEALQTQIDSVEETTNINKQNVTDLYDLKADKTELTVIDVKVNGNIQSINTLNSNKADKTSISNLENIKADKTSVSVLENTKANKTDVINLENNKADKSEIIRVDSRINNIITSPVDGVNAQEVIDARRGKTTLGAKVMDMDNRIDSALSSIQSYMYKNGNEYADKTGGWSLSFQSDATTANLTKNTDNMYFYVASEGGYAEASIETEFSIELTHVKNIYIDWKQDSTDLSTRTTLEVNQARGTKRYTGEYIWFERNFARRTNVLNVSQLTGNHYIKFDTGGNGTINIGKLTVYSIYLEYDLISAVNTGSSISSYIPSYWVPTLNGKINTINTLQSKGGVGSSSFGFVTDTHLSVNNKRSPVLIRTLMEECDIPYFIHGGDFVTGSGSATKTSLLSDIEITKDMFGDKMDRVLMVEGNHDRAYGVDTNLDPIYYYAKNLTNEEVYSYMFRQNSLYPSRVIGGNGTYYYQDDKTSKIRYIVLNSSDLPYGVDGSGNSIIKYNVMRTGCMRLEQAKWFTEVALNVPSSDWNVVVFSHIEPFSVDMNVQNGNLLAYALQAFKNKSTFNGTSGANVNDEFKYSLNVDYSGKGGNVIGWISGHMHDDRMNRNRPYDINYNLVEVLNDDTSVYFGNPTKTVGTISEQAFDIFTVNTKSKFVNITRVGAGVDRSFSY